MEIGIDIEETKRFSKLASGSPFVRRVYSKKEIEYCYSRPEPAQHLAARFAAKEAYYKCIAGNPARKPIDYSQVEILPGKGGKPEVFISGKKHKRIKVSLSHTANYAMAAVLVE